MANNNQDIRKLPKFIRYSVSNGRTIYRFDSLNYTYHNEVEICHSPTANCQISSAVGIGPLLNELNEYHVRDLLINIRRHHKKILLLDLNSCYVDSFLLKIPPSAIISKTDYISTNNSKMVLILVKLNSIRQLQLPKT